jgi:hypothetical protein
VATQGYAAFGEAMGKAQSQPASNEIERLKAMGRAYLTFARDNPAYYSAMFESGLNFSDYPELRKAADATFAGLRLAVEGMIAGMPAEPQTTCHDGCPAHLVDQPRRGVAVWPGRWRGLQAAHLTGRTA